MQFKLLPVIDLMLDLYNKPRNFSRFEEYIKILTGNTDNDIDIPIGGFNPMAKDHVIVRLKELQALQAETVINDTIRLLNTEFLDTIPETTFKVALTLADDLEGGWTNRYTTDYASKFKNGAITKRGFCTPHFWTSEDSSKELIILRTQEYCYRAIHQLSNPKPATLQEHLQQEHFVNKHTKQKVTLKETEYYQALYNQYKHTEEYPIIFNFLYGDKAASDLGYAPMGVKEEMVGFKFAAIFEV